MELKGFVQNGVIVLTGGASLPEGTPVTVSCGVELVSLQPEKKRVQVPLVRTGKPGSMNMNNERIVEIFVEEDVAAGRVVGVLSYDDSPWTDEERDALRSEALDDLGWEGMEVYQDEAQ